MTSTPAVSPATTGRISFRDSIAIGRLRAQRSTWLAGRSAAGNILWPWFIGPMLAELGGRGTRVHRTADANMTLRGDGDAGGETFHPAAAFLGGLLLAVQAVAMALLGLLALALIFGGGSFTFTPWTAVALALTGPLWVEIIGTCWILPAVWLLRLRVRRLRAAGETVTVMTGYVRRADMKGAGRAMAQPVIDGLSQQRVIVIGIAANSKLAKHYKSLGAVHDTRSGKPGWHRRMRFDYPGRDTAY